MKFYKNFLEKIIIGTCFGIGFIVPVLWPLGILGAGWYLVRLFDKEYSYGYGSSYSVWLVKSLILTSWVWAVYPIDWLTIPLGKYELPLIGFYWFTVSVSLACGGLVFHALVSLWQKHNFKNVLFAVPIFLLLSEVLGSLFFSLLMHGPGGTIGFNFSMGYTGYLLMEHQWLAWLANIGGVYLLSIVFGCLAVGVYWAFKWRQKLAFGAVVILLLVTQFIPIKVAESSGAELLDVMHVDTYFNASDFESEENKAKVKSSLAEAMRVAEDANPDYIILPEDTDLFEQQTNEKILSETLKFLYSDTDTVIVDSGRVQYSGSDVIQVALYDGGVEQLYQSHKRYLVPQGEYMPYLYRFVLGWFDHDDVTDLLNDRLDLVVGNNISQARYADNLPGILFCFEVVDPLAIKTLMNERDSLPFVAHIVSHAFINESPAFRHQLESMLRTQAIWNDVYIVVAGNELPGFTITPSGEVWQSSIVSEGEKWKIGLIKIPVR